MPRPRKKRNVCLDLRTAHFRPQGISEEDIVEIVLEVDEMEAIRLADLEGWYQEDAAARMKVSRATFSNTINRAHAKIAEALIRGKAIRINCPRFATKSNKENL